MALRVEQGFYDWDRAIDDDGDLVEAEIPYFVFGAPDEDTALVRVKATAPAKQDDLVLQKVELVERSNLDTFKVRAVYGEDPEKEKEGEDEDDTNFTFDSSGGTMHMDVSLETKGKFPADAPDFKRAINVDNESNVNGCEIVMPTSSPSGMPAPVRFVLLARAAASRTSFQTEAEMATGSPGRTLFMAIL